MICRYYYLLLISLFLVACGTVQNIESVSPSLVSTSIAHSTIVAVRSSVFPEPSARSNKNVIQATTPSVSNPSSSPMLESSATHTPSNIWKTIVWQHIQFMIPPQSTWQESNVSDAQITNVNLLHRGIVSYPEESTNIEGLQGPTFTIIAFSGSTDDWLQTEQSRNLPNNPIDAQTIRHQEMAGVSAIAYQRAVKGIATIEYYALKMNDQDLLWITTQDTENKTYRTILQSLTLH